MTAHHPSHHYSLNFFQGLRTQTTVVSAIVLHDIKSRYFGNGIGQIIVVLWPLAHFAILLLIYNFTGRTAPFGTSTVLYSATGVLPFMVWSYASRWIVLSPLQNRAFLAYPIVRPIDLIVGRSILEVISSFIVTTTILVVLVALGIDARPISYVQAFLALLTSILLALGFGLTFASLSLVTPFVAMFYTIFIIIFYAGSGILFVAGNLPTQAQYYLSYNPILQLVEWMRSAYYLDYPSSVLDRPYVVILSLFMIAFGLIFERIARRFL